MHLHGFGELTSQGADAGGSGLYSARYTRDSLGRIATKTETVNGATDTFVYSYDTAGRLIGVTRNGTPVAQYQYDTNGNRIGGFNQLGSLSAHVDSQDRLVRQNNTTYTHNANGDLTAQSTGGVTRYFHYDALGSLRQARLPGDLTIDYVIDGKNRRVGKKINGVLKQGFLYQDQLAPIAELDGNGDIVTRFVYGTRPNVPDYLIKGGNTYRLITDHLGSPRLIVDVNTGDIAQRMDYDEFGNVLTDTHPGFQPFGFAGGLYDQHTGLARFGARDYDPQTGRWTAKDPIGFRGGDANLYGYVLGDPIDSVDPTGLDVCLESTNNANVPFGLHQRVAVYDSSGKFVYGQSFGTTNPNTGLSTSEGRGDSNNYSGEVYPDVRDSMRDKKQCTSSTDKQNKRIISTLQSQLGARGPYSATGIGGMSCRTYSAATYDQISNYLRSGGQ